MVDMASGKFMRPIVVVPCHSLLPPDVSTRAPEFGSSIIFKHRRFAITVDEIYLLDDDDPVKTVGGFPVPVTLPRGPGNLYGFRYMVVDENAVGRGGFYSRYNRVASLLAGFEVIGVAVFMNTLPRNFGKRIN